MARSLACWEGTSAAEGLGGQPLPLLPDLFLYGGRANWTSSRRHWNFPQARAPSCPSSALLWKGNLSPALLRHRHRLACQKRVRARAEKARIPARVAEQALVSAEVRARGQFRLESRETE